ncbi:VacB and RNase II family 3'-5' exoribonuclease [Pseudoloma neurophilia]|uniref:DIS3-like exonuclease 1 n=1 Tax=Pseudoloma neurophilia TaxID=146866 RepID=A0A0R0M0X4_9MICR|nr:VacB and RNase II family 3'-5' exoribonuclease [Pseudoloma neurophilia]
MSKTVTFRNHSYKNDTLSTNISQFYRKTIECGLDCCLQSAKKGDLWFIPTPATFGHHHIFSNAIITQSLIANLPGQISKELEHYLKNDNSVFVFQDLVCEKIPVFEGSLDKHFENILKFFQAHRPDLQFTLEPEALPEIPETFEYSEYHETENHGTFYCNHYSNGYIKANGERFDVIGLENVNRAIWGDTVYFEEIEPENHLGESFIEYDGLDGYHNWHVYSGNKNTISYDKSKGKYAKITGIKSRRVQTMVANKIDTLRTFSEQEKNTAERSSLEGFHLVKPIGDKFPPLLVTSFDENLINKYVIVSWPKHSKYPFAKQISTRQKKIQKKLPNEKIQKTIDSLFEMYNIQNEPNTNLNIETDDKNDHEIVNFKEICLLHGETLRKAGVISSKDQDVSIEENSSDYLKKNLKKINPNRLDLTGLKIVSIDPPGCTDIDDCLSISRIDYQKHENLTDEQLFSYERQVTNTKSLSKKCKRFRPQEVKNDSEQNVSHLGSEFFRVGIHIADVSSFIPANSACNQDAMSRSTTIYLNHLRLDMIPEIFSSDLCSLKNGQLRLAMSVLVDIEIYQSKEGQKLKIHDLKISESLINSHASLTYQQAEDILNDQNHPLNQNLSDLNRISIILKQQRMASGAINIDSPEIRFNPFENKLSNKKSLQSNSLIEEMMILANHLVGKFIFHNCTQWILRKHDAADLPTSSEILQIDRKSESTKNAFNKENLNENTPLSNVQLIRSMKKALYTDKFPIFHSGLSLLYYTHFTSPIRRYPDLLVHRTIKNVIFDQKNISDYDIRHLNKKSRDAQIISRECNEQFIYWEYLNKSNDLIHGKDGTFAKDTSHFTAYRSNVVKSNGQFFTLAYISELDVDCLLKGKIEKEKFKVKWIKDDYYWQNMNCLKMEEVFE